MREFAWCLPILHPGPNGSILSEDSVLRQQLSEESQRGESCVLGHGGALLAVSPQSTAFLFQLLSLTLDGLTGVSQDHMRAHYQTGSNHMMLNVNLWSTLLLGAGKEQFCCSFCVSPEGRLPSLSRSLAQMTVAHFAQAEVLP